MAARLRLVIVTLLSLALPTVACREELIATSNALRGDGYALDAIPRELSRGTQATCPEGVESVVYRGTALKYASPVLIAPAFAPKLERFERLVAELATAQYGRPPARVTHFGGRSCRSVRGRAARLSEHALGNALDVSGFQFDAVAPAAASEVTLPNAFTISVKQHWGQDRKPRARVHARFLRALMERVIGSRMFRGVVGPGHEGHADHFHFDQAPWRYSLR